MLVLLCCWLLVKSITSQDSLTDVDLTTRSPQCPWATAPLNGDPTEHLFENVAVQRGTPSACISDVVSAPREPDFTVYTQDDQMMIDADPVNPAPCVSSKHVYMPNPGKIEAFGVVNSDPTRDQMRDSAQNFYPNDRSENFNRLTAFARNGGLEDVIKQPNYPWGFAGGYLEGGSPLESFDQNRSPINWSISSMPIVTTQGLDMTSLFPQSGVIPKIDPNLLETLYGSPCHDVYKAVWQNQ